MGYSSVRVHVETSTVHILNTKHSKDFALHMWKSILSPLWFLIAFLRMDSNDTVELLFV
jgi:hypothetical protein